MGEGVQPTLKQEKKKTCRRFINSFSLRQQLNSIATFPVYVKLGCAVEPIIKESPPERKVFSYDSRSFVNINET